MNSQLLLYFLAQQAVLIALMAFLPELSRPTVPLGVSVPSTRVGESVVAQAKRRYRLGVLIGGAVSALSILALAAHPEFNAVVTVFFVGWCAVVFARCRRPIIEAKHREGWYDNVQVRVYASVTKTRSATPQWALLTLALGISVAALVTVAFSYGHLPERIPMHYNAAGQIDSWGERTWLSALMPGLIGLGLTVMMIAVSVHLSRRHDAQLPDGSLATAREVQQSKDRMVQTVLAVSALSTAAVLAVLALAPVIRFSAMGLGILLWCLLAASFLPTVWLIIETARHHKRTALGSSVTGVKAPGPESPDDDHLWPWGLMYLNHEDPRVFVPKRSGVGITFNAGHPLGMALTCLIVLVLLATLAGVVTVAAVGA